MTALRPYASGSPAWKELENFFVNETLRPLAKFLCTSNSSDGYVQGLRQLRTYHAQCSVALFRTASCRQSVAGK
ncbi:unnamed protein product [Symbiodinium microadriaticum]|nr:ppdK [Symbiodinium sp. KB8]CAE7248160.1 unnamed protein product [Symbiodinium microadriaticum]